MNPNDESSLGIINPHELYTITALKRRLGITDSSLRAARRKGLKVFYAHKQGFVLGEHWINHVLQGGNSSNGRPTSDRELREAQ